MGLGNGYKKRAATIPSSYSNNQKEMIAAFSTCQNISMWYISGFLPSFEYAPPDQCLA